MMQSKRQSACEATLNTASGFLLSLGAGYIIFPALGWAVTSQQNLAAVSLFTVISVLRSYFWRRVFNWWHHRPKTFIGEKQDV